MESNKIKLVIAGLGGRGHDIYGNYAIEHPDEVEIVAIADPRPDRLELAQRGDMISMEIMQLNIRTK